MSKVIKVQDGVLEFNVATSDLSWDGNTLVANANNAATGTVGIETDSSNTADKSYVGVWNAESTQYTEIAAHGSTFGGGTNSTMYTSTNVSPFDFLGDYKVLMQLDSTSAANSFVNIMDGTALRVYDDGETDYIQIIHDGTVATISTPVGMGGIDINPATGTQFKVLGDASGGRIRQQPDGDATSYIEMYHNTTTVAWINSTDDIRLNSVTDVVGVNSGNEFRMYGGIGTQWGSFQHDGTNLNLTAGTLSGTTDFVMGADFTGNIKSEKSISILEASAAIADTLTYGQIWVRDDAPNTLMFTDDVGTDFAVAGAAANVLPTGTTTHATLRWDGSNWVESLVAQTDTTGLSVYNGANTIRIRHDASQGVVSTNSGDLVFLPASNITRIQPAENFRITGGAGLDYGNWSHNGTDLNLTFAQTDNYVIGSGLNNNIKAEKSVSILEASAAIADTANYGQVWVRDDVPNTLMFTDDTGQDIQVSPYRATLQTLAVTTTEIIAIPVASGSGFGFRINIIGTEDATGDTVFESIFGAIRNQAGTTAIVGSSITDRTDDAGASTWVITVAADDTADALTVDVAGENAHTIDWKVSVELLDV